MRLDFVFVLVAFGTVIACANCASQVLTSADVQRESDDHKSLQEDLLSKMAATSESQDSANTMHSVGRIMNAVFGHVQKFSLKLAKNLFSKLKLGGLKFGQNLKSGVRKFGQGVSRGGRRFGQTLGGEGGRRFRQQILKGGRRELGRALEGTKKFIINHRKGISKGLGRFTGEAIGRVLDRNTGENYLGGDPGRYRYPDTDPNEAPGNPNTSPGYPYRHREYSDTAPRYPDTARGTPKHSSNQPGGGETYPHTAPRYPDTARGTPKHSPNQPGGGETYPPASKPQGEKVLVKLLEEQVAPLQQDSFIRKQNKYRYSRRGTLYKIKRFFKDIYQGLYSLYLSN